jgi:uncharacterized protein (DUF302 family)
MLDRKVHRLLVVDGQALVGIVTAFDILGVVARGARSPSSAADRETLGFEVSLPQGFDEATERVSEALRAEGFGVLTRIDLDRAFAEKLGITFDRFAILGACNPPLAHRAMTRDRKVGLLLPCNVTVEEAPTGSLVRMVDPRAMMGIGQFGEDDVVREIAEEARTRFARVARALAARTRAEA